MFANTQCSAMNFAFPDVCNTPVGPAVVPLPYPNIAMTSTAIPNIYNQYIMCMPVQNLMTEIPVSLGDSAGVSLGVASGSVMGPLQYLLGSFKIYKTVMPAVKMLTLTGQNGISLNIAGMTLTPSQTKVMHLS